MSGATWAGAQSRRPATAIHTCVLTDIHLLSNVRTPLCPTTPTPGNSFSVRGLAPSSHGRTRAVARPDDGTPPVPQVGVRGYGTKTSVDWGMLGLSVRTVTWTRPGPVFAITSWTG